MSKKVGEEFTHQDPNHTFYKRKLGDDYGFDPPPNIYIILMKEAYPDIIKDHIGPCK